MPRQRKRQRYEIIASVQGVYWPEVDADISASDMLGRVPARPP